MSRKTQLMARIMEDFIELAALNDRSVLAEVQDMAVSLMETLQEVPFNKRTDERWV